MSSSLDFVTFVTDVIAPVGDVSAKKMFGDYMVYADGRPIILVCDDTAYVKICPTTDSVFNEFGVTPNAGTPYQGAKPHYILDIDNGALACAVARGMALVTPIPIKKSNRKRGQK